MIGKMSGQKSGTPLAAFLPQLSRETERETGREKVVTKRKPLGEPTKIGNLFVVLKMKRMKKVGPQYGVKSQDSGFRLVSYIGLITFEDYYTVLQPISVGFFNLLSP